MQLIKVMDESAIEDGVWFQLDHPTQEGEKLFKGGDTSLPCRVKVRSTASKAYRAQNLQQMARNQGRISRAKFSERDSVQAQVIGENTPRWFAVVLAATENLDVDKPGVVIPTQEESIALAADSDAQWLVDQVINFSAEGKNFGIAPVSPPKAPVEGAGSQPSKASSAD